ncbi:PIN domain-containing protein [Patescibacteria group bacterium]|nr:PIN domain-containing protein [Patescibacteria group bacterium]MBU1499951.1 PIN domain-containing protein [Patescibacteria group bacterium]
MRPIKVFLDSDVIISSLLSSAGAAYLLVNKKSVDKYISNLSVKEIKIVAKRLGIKSPAVNKLINHIKIVRLKKVSGKNYVTDVNDSHIIAGAVTAKVRFLLSYNLKHFKIEKIKRDFNILVYRPAQFLQYLRSL